jgi:hypothetical protein
MLAWMFWLFLVCALSLVVIKGGGTERWFSAAIALSVVCTFLLNRELGWIAAQKVILLVDITLLLLSLVLVSKSHRHWPIWFSAFQSIAVATSVAFFVFPNHVPSLYINAQGFWFFPALMSMTIGVILDSRKA